MKFPPFTQSSLFIFICACFAPCTLYAQGDPNNVIDGFVFEFLFDETNEIAGINRVEGVTVELFVIDPAGPDTSLRAVELTNSDGVYSFGVLDDSTYLVKFIKDSPDWIFVPEDSTISFVDGSPGRTGDMETTMTSSSSKQVRLISELIRPFGIISGPGGGPNKDINGCPEATWSFGTIQVPFCYSIAGNKFGMARQDRNIDPDGYVAIKSFSYVIKYPDDELLFEGLTTNKTLASSLTNITHSINLNNGMRELTVIGEGLPGDSIPNLPLNMSEILFKTLFQPLKAGKPSISIEAITLNNGFVDIPIAEFNISQPDLTIVSNEKGETEFAYSIDSYPNPFSTSLNIIIDTFEARYVKIELFNVHGREIALINDKSLIPGRNHIVWDALQNGGNYMAAGVYFLRINNGRQTKVIPVIKQ